MTQPSSGKTKNTAANADAGTNRDTAIHPFEKVFLERCSFER